MLLSEKVRNKFGRGRGIKQILKKGQNVIINTNSIFMHVYLELFYSIR